MSRPASSPGSCGARERDERGATALIVALLMSLVLLIVSAFAIDLGMQRAGRRDMQALADLVALDMGRLIDGRTRAQIEAGTGDKPSAASQLGWSVANNDNNTIGARRRSRRTGSSWTPTARTPQSGGVPVEVAVR